MSRRRLRQWARQIKQDVHALSFAARDPRVPWYAKVAAVAAYALSPIDLIPDFIPVIGYLDDLVIVPLGIFLAVKLVPSELMSEFRAAAATAAAEGERMLGKWGASLVILLWVLGVTLAAVWMRAAVGKMLRGIACQP